MIVSVKDEAGAIVWEYGVQNGIPGGTTNKSFIHDGTQQLIIDHLAMAMNQASAELAIFSDGGSHEKR